MGDIHARGTATVVGPDGRDKVGASSRKEAAQSIANCMARYGQFHEPKWLMLARAIRQAEKYWECV